MATTGRARQALMITVAAALVAACGTDVRPVTEGPAVIRVPEDAATVTAAVGAAREGDLVLIGPGEYRESVAVTTPGVTLRGLDRDTVVVDGEGRRPNGIVVTAPRVTVENLTVRGHTLNGVLVTGMADENGGLAHGSDGYQRLDLTAFPPLPGFRVSRVTAANNGLYGIYAFNARDGVIEDSYASGSSDSGIYVGQCKPCHTLVRGNVAERNAVGYEAANASLDIHVIGNRFSGNRVGLTSNSDYQEALVPQTGAVFAGNVISGNAAPDSPAQAEGGFGVGVGIAGGRDNLLVRNLVIDNPTAGVVLASAEDLPPLDNRLQDNTITGNGVDLVHASSARAPGVGNCVDGGRLGTVSPAGFGADCAAPAAPGVPLPVVDAPPGMSFREVPPPPPQPSMPDAATAPWGPAEGLPDPVDVAAVPLPAADLLATSARG